MSDRLSNHDETRLDPERLRLLADLTASAGPTVGAELYRAFESSSARQIEALRVAVAAVDVAAVAAAAHALKGSALNLGATGLGRDASEIESAALAGGLLPSAARVDRLAEERRWVLAAVRSAWAVGEPAAG